MINNKASSITEFCNQHSISRALFYKLQKQGKAPRVMTVGRRKLISNEAAKEWREAMQEAS